MKGEGKGPNAVQVVNGTMCKSYGGWPFAAPQESLFTSQTPQTENEREKSLIIQLYAIIFLRH